MTTGQLIKEARERAGLTQDELGKKIGVTGVAVMRYEKGQRQPRIEQLRAIAAALGVPIAQLLPPDNYWEDADGNGHTEPMEPPKKAHPKAPVFKYGPVSSHAMLTIHPDENTEEGRRFIEAEKELVKIALSTTPKDRIDAALDRLNDEGQEKAAERVEELTEIPKYQK